MEVLKFLRPRHGRSRLYNTESKKGCILWKLPEEIVLNIVRKLHITDLLNLASTHPYFRDLLSSNPSIWQTVSYHGTWPTVPNMKHFMRAAEHSNIEALVKLGVAFLYNEGLPGPFDKDKIATNGARAAELFCAAEVSTPSVSAFTWLFTRPPWARAATSPCCKERVFNHMKDFVTETPDPSVQVCISKTLRLLDPELYRTEAEQHLILASEAGLTAGNGQSGRAGAHDAALLLWTEKYAKVYEPSAELDSIRELREIARTGYYDSQLLLCHRYVAGSYGGISRDQAAAYVRGFIQKSKPTYVKDAYTVNGLSNTKRYILLDWLVEVASMKSFSSQTLHLAVSVVDRFLRLQRIPRNNLQLVGVAALVLCARFLGREIMTIREAAWLTDNTYSYSDIVRMMGEVTATLGGRLKVPVALDYVSVLCELAAVDTETSYLAEYFCELALLQSSLGDFSRAHLAAACLLMANLTWNTDKPWSKDLELFTGFQMTDLQDCVMELYTRCLQDRTMVDYRNVVIQAVSERYTDKQRMEVSNIPVLPKEELCSKIGLTMAQVQQEVKDQDSPISSPASSSSESLDSYSWEDGASFLTTDSSQLSDFEDISAIDCDLNSSKLSQHLADVVGIRSSKKRKHSGDQHQQKANKIQKLI